MLQLYFLSVFCNISAGILLARETRQTDAGELRLAGGPYRLVLGVVTTLTGLLTLVSPINDGVPIVGDLVPSLFALVLGASLIYEYVHQSSIMPLKTANLFNLLLDAHRKTLGKAGILAGILHFILPGVMFL